MAHQAYLDSADMAIRSITTTTVMGQASWLHLSGFPREVQSTVEGLPFEGQKLFAGKTESLHSLKDSRATLRSLGIYIQATKHKQGGYYTLPVLDRLPICRPRDNTIPRGADKGHPSIEQTLLNSLYHNNLRLNIKI